MEVTQGQWEAVMGTTPLKGKTYKERELFEGRFRLPGGLRVNWDHAMSFCQKLTEKERSAGRLQRDWEYTLPTEAQWEYACRAGTNDAVQFWRRYRRTRSVCVVSP